jgi:hypothetical protein
MTTTTLHSEFYNNLYGPVYMNTAPAAGTAGALLDAIAQATSFHILAYLGRDHNIHLVHRMDKLHPSLTLPVSPNVNCTFGILDEYNEFGGT